MLSVYSPSYRPLGSPAHWFLALPGFTQPQAQKNRLPAPLTGFEASLAADSLEELIRDLAGWSVPPAGPAGAGRTGAQWLW